MNARRWGDGTKRRGVGGTVRVWQIDRCLLPGDDCRPMRELRSIARGKVFLDRWICETCTRQAIGGQPEGAKIVKKLWLENPRGDEDPIVVEVDSAGREVEIDGQTYERAEEFVWLEDEWVEIYQRVASADPAQG